MSIQSLSGNDIRQNFIDFFKEKAGHTVVRSSSLVPGGDSTLLFTNAGMVQFKDVFLGTDKRPYTRAVNSQKCLRVAGKHNDLDDVGQDDTHHTFFEMLGNWSFGDYYKKEAIAWAWELLTEVWKIPKDNLYATVFMDDLGEIPTDEEAARIWRKQPGFNPKHLFYLGRKDNFWEMADTGPCGPCSEIHIDLRPGDGPVVAETLETDRFTELWNLVFIQYNRTGPNHLESLPETHIDTGLGFERIVSILQGVNSNYRTDLFWPLIQTTQGITEHSETEINNNFTSYRVIADHARAAAFLIADGVVPGNLGRNYICRMIIRRAFRFASKIGIDQPFLARVALTVIKLYGGAYPELVQNQNTILELITREEEQFQRTLERGTVYLNTLINQMESEGLSTISGEQAANMYTTYGMPLEITRDIAREHAFQVDEKGFIGSMEAHRLASGAGKAMGELGGEDVALYRQIRVDLQNSKKISTQGVVYDPYGNPQDLVFETELLAIVKDSQSVESVEPGNIVEIILTKTKFYLESGGQVSDVGFLSGDDWLIRINELRKPAAGIITHIGEVISGKPRVGEKTIGRIDSQRRIDIMRNHTATHLLHSALHEVLGKHARQAGSLVAPDRLRFDFTHHEALTEEEIEKIEKNINQKILANYKLHIAYKDLNDAIQDGAIALFGEKYEETVRNITIGKDHIFSNELCGGTHVNNTSEIGIFIIVNEGSAAAGIRRIEAITGREAFDLIHTRLQSFNHLAEILTTNQDQIISKVQENLADLKELRSQLSVIRKNLALSYFDRYLENVPNIGGVHTLTAVLEDSNAEVLRGLADRFRIRYPQNGVVVLASVVNSRPIIIAAVTQDLTKRGIMAGDLAGFVARHLGGGGGGKPTLAQAGGKDASKLDEALAMVASWVDEHLD